MIGSIYLLDIFFFYCVHHSIVISWITLVVPCGSKQVLFCGSKCSNPDPVHKTIAMILNYLLPLVFFLEIKMATASSYGFLTTNNRSFPWQIISMKSRLFTPRTARASFKTVRIYRLLFTYFISFCVCVFWCIEEITKACFRIFKLFCARFFFYLLQLYGLIL